MPTTNECFKLRLLCFLQTISCVADELHAPGVEVVKVEVVAVVALEDGVSAVEEVARGAS